MKIEYIKHREIDRTAYSRCVETSLQGTVYAMPWYLDIVAPGWDILASCGYEYVMPLPVKKKYGIRYAVQPPLCQQLGIFSSSPVTQEIFDLFTTNIPYTDYDLRFNSGNMFGNHNGRTGQNHLLDLNRPYEEIRSKYKHNCLRNIQKARTYPLIPCHLTDQREYIGLLTAHASPDSGLKLVSLLEKLLGASGQHTPVEIWNVRDDASQEILSCAFFIYWKNRIYYLMPAVTPDGRKKQSMSFLLDTLIRSKSSKDYILDFEGSSVPNVARFYEGFGAGIEAYPHVVRRSLPGRLYHKIIRGE